jgi:drug/metabolite transporter (DMT)-like permease
MLAYTRALAAAALFSLNGPIAVYLLNKGLSPAVILAARFWVAWAGLTIAFALARTAPGRIEGGLRVIGPFAAMVICSHFVFLVAVRVLPIANVAILVYSAPAILVLYEAIQHRKAPSARLLAALLLALVGALLVLQPQGGEPISVQVVLLAVALPGSYAAYMTLAARMPASVDSTTLLWWTWLGATIIAAPMAILQVPTISFDSAVPILYLGLLGTLGSFLLIIAAVRRAPPSRVAIVAVAEVPLAAFAAFALLGQRLALMQLLGGLVVAVAVAIIYLSRPAVVIHGTVDRAASPEHFVREPQDSDYVR